MFQKQDRVHAAAFAVSDLAVDEHFTNRKVLHRRDWVQRHAAAFAMSDLAVDEHFTNR